LGGVDDMSRIREIDVFITASLTFLFVYAVWSIDISVGAITTGSYIITITGYSNAFNFYHNNIILLIAIFFMTIGYFLIRFHHIRTWKNE